MEDLCPCGSSKKYAECCEPIIRGTTPASTAEQLMRSRYTAYAKTEVAHIMDTTHPDKRKDCDENAIRSWSVNSEWDSLEVVSTSKGLDGDSEGTVEFIANFTENRIKKTLHELAVFKKVNDQWFYVDSEIKPSKPFVRTELKINRNDPCTCGSGKKYKKCCGVAA